MKRQMAYLILVLSTLFWGVSFVFVKEGVTALSPWTFLTYRFAVAVVGLAVMFPGLFRHLNGHHFKQGAAVGVALFAGVATQTVGIAGTSASQAAFIAGTSLVFLPLLRYFIERRPISSGEIGSGVLALMGLGILTLQSAAGFSQGDFWVLVSAVAFAGQIMLVDRTTGNTNPLALTFVQLLVCSVLCLGASLAVHGTVPLPATGEIWQAIAFTGLLGTAFTYGAMNLAQQQIEAQKVALIFVLEPVFATAAAVLLLNEPLSLRFLLGGGLILLALVLAEYRPKGGMKVPVRDWVQRWKKGMGKPTLLSE